MTDTIADNFFICSSYLNNRDIRSAISIMRNIFVEAIESLLHYTFNLLIIWRSFYDISYMKFFH